MYTVKNCLECGKPVSTSVSKCPHCQTQYPRGTCCKACKEAVRFSKSVKFRKYNNYYECFHNECYQLITQSFQLAPDYICNYSCPACKKSYQSKYFDSSHDKDDHQNIGTDSIYIFCQCDNCGHAIEIKEPRICPYANCYFCSLKLSKSNAVQVTVLNSEQTPETYYAHSYCSNRPPNKKDITDQNNRVITAKYQQEKRDFWNSGTHPVIPLIFDILAGYFLILVKVWWLNIIGILFMIYACIIIFLMLKYSS